VRRILPILSTLKAEATRYATHVRQEATSRIAFPLQAETEKKINAFRPEIGSRELIADKGTAAV
jgi:hypothetical protein